MRNGSELPDFSRGSLVPERSLVGAVVSLPNYERAETKGEASAQEMQENPE